MSTKKNPKQANQMPASICWFDIPADDIDRARKFYNSLFGWKINAFPGMPDYWPIDTGGDNASPDGAVMKRKQPGHSITNYISVPSVTRYIAKIENLLTPEQRAEIARVAVALGATSLAVTAALFLNAGTQTAAQSRGNFIV